MKLKWSHIGIFVVGMLASTAGVKAVTNKTAKKVYTWLTAMGLRGRDEVMTQVETVRAACDDIYADAIEYNKKCAEEKAAAQEAVIE